MLNRYEPVIGLEIHAELMTQSKMFCGCRVVDSVTAAPNTAVCPVCLGMPGMLPVINRRAIDFAVRVALALGCDIQPHNIFARKNYFYPDLPKGYQISQYELPIGRHGALDVTLPGGRTSRIGIRRVHIEEDTGKLTHRDGGSLVDYNRSGVPLLEIVSEPDIRSGEEARAYATRIRQILRYLDVNSGDMEKGVLRIEPNISLRPRGSDAFGTRTELKNLNSFRALADGTDYELTRQAAVLDGGGRVIQETRGWHDTRRETFSQRVKEEAEDYRYFAEPDLPPLLIDPDWMVAARAALPELPQAKEARYTDAHGLSPYEAAALAEDRAVAEWFDAVIAAGGRPKTAANWILNDLFRLMNERGRSIADLPVSPAAFVALLGRVEGGEVNGASAREVLAEMVDSGGDPAAIIAARGLSQLSDEAALAAIIDGIIAANPDAVANYLGGKESLLAWFVGQAMRATRGQGNPALINRLLRERLEARRSA
ncbi:Aspartyl/glutamyl-tRNA(Asn/Gln) amidotransferase subunit B [Candidatus Promineifilum breve]|uniref:Aspartyl/glutamyl-tRNA(Asn/Gln) amidotransferase subunit B n=1 Tax=Candidatus Promineifilum breve TaxID=1806508 RepID=A0A160T2R9_9CHLR|nr:Asp-tRNA(Asn)/Glu-tRNA(Gln) amidotransferase subunit GatB [Candidatus Promineifilum breve]CUS03198.2 Aspartyl/glutamyl-tRNA(Asn/Gln) amidotransferase subunit B [Candidatus Promineifilum breve]